MRSLRNVFEGFVRDGVACWSCGLLAVLALVQGHAATAKAAGEDSQKRHAPPAAPREATPTPVIFDTDITGDCDDVLALAMLHALADRRECDIKAVTISKIHPLNAPFVDAVNTFYGRGALPIGVTRDAQRRDSKYLELCKQTDDGQLRYPHDLPTSDQAPDAVAVLRRTLAAQPDQSVVIIQVGLAANLAALLRSPADDISPLSGRELAARKCKLVSVMAGCFGPALGKPQHAEANVVNGIEAMQFFAEHWPQSVPVVWSDFRIGLAARYPRESIARDFRYRAHHIVPEAYLLHSGPDHDRPSWDLTSVLYAVRPDEGYFDLSPAGRVTVDDRGLTEFVPQPHGRDRYLKMDHQQRVRVVAVQRTLASQPPRCGSPDR
jgi:inosine-uridine nucleoside N-ribohydrolase